MKTEVWVAQMSDGQSLIFPAEGMTDDDVRTVCSTLGKIAEIITLATAEVKRAL
jgi:hypothetical protein